MKTIFSVTLLLAALFLATDAVQIIVSAAATTWRALKKLQSMTSFCCDTCQISNQLSLCVASKQQWLYFFVALWFSV